EPCRPPPSQEHHRRSDRRHGEGGDKELPIEQAHLDWKLVEWRETPRHQRLVEIEPQTVEDHRRACGHRIPLEGCDERVRVLRVVPYCGACDAKHYERNLLHP